MAAGIPDRHAQNKRWRLMAAILLPRTWIAGTPRGWGSRHIEDEWLHAMHIALGSRWQGRPAAIVPVAVELTFCIWPDSPRYNGQNRPHGTDLDNMVKLTIDGLTPYRGRGLKIIEDDRCVFQITARKELVRSDSAMGAWIEIAAMP
jgi:Holliday junction resolvase RusA-like endonuclease